MSKKAKAETQPAKDETPKAVAFEVGQIVKGMKDGEVVFVGAIDAIDADELRGDVVFLRAGELGHGFKPTSIAPLTPDELTRYTAVTQQTTLGMGNIIDAVING